MSTAPADATPPGVYRLGRVIGGSGPGAARVVGVLEEVARQRNRATARMLRAVYDAGRAVVGSADLLAGPDEFSGDEVAACLGWSRTMAGRWIDLATDLSRRLPAVLDAMDEGDLDDAKARALSDWTRDLAADHAAAVADTVLPRAPRLTVAELITWVQELAVALDPEWAARREARARTRARVVGGSNPSGTANLAGRDLPVDEAAAAMARLDALAAEVRAAGVGVPISRVRSVVYLRLVDGAAVGLDDAALIDVVVRELREPDDGPDDDGPDDEGPDDEGPDDEGPDDEGPDDEGPDDGGPDDDGPEDDGPTDNGPRGGPDDGGPDDGPHDGGPDVSRDGDLIGDAASGQVPSPSGPATGVSATAQTSCGPEEPDPAGEAPDPAGPLAPRSPDLGGESPDAPDVAEVPPPTRGLRRGTVEVRVRLSTLLGLDERPAQVPGWGPVLAGTARSMVAAMHDAEWRLVITDAAGRLRHVLLTRHRPDRPGPPHRPGRPAGRAGPGHRVRGRGIVEIQTSTLLLTGPPLDLVPAWAGLLGWARERLANLPAAGSSPDDAPGAGVVARRRRPSAELDRWVRVRDRSCVGMGCGRPARVCDLDHTQDWALGGPTAGWNLDAVCRHDHRAKHVGGWRLVQPEPGEFVWTSRAGRRYLRCARPVTAWLPAPMPVPPGGRRLPWAGPVPRDGWLDPPSASRDRGPTRTGPRGDPRRDDDGVPAHPALPARPAHPAATAPHPPDDPPPF